MKTSRKISFILITALILCAIASFAVYAQDTAQNVVKLDIDRENNAIVIEGSGFSDDAGRRMSIIMGKAEVSEASLEGMDASNIESLTEYASVATVDDNGNFSVPVSFSGTYGTYVIVLKGVKTDKVVKKFLYCDEAMLVEKANQAATADDMRLLIEFSVDMLGVSMSDAEAFDAAHQTMIFAAMAAIDDYDSAASIKQAYEREILAQTVIANQSDKAALKTIIEDEDNQDLFTLKESNPTLFARFIDREAINTLVYDDISTATITGFADLNSLISESIILKATYKSQGKREMDAIISAAAAECELDLSIYNLLIDANKDTLLGSMNNKNYATMTDFINEFANLSTSLYRTQQTIIVNPGAGTGSGGGGGGGGGSYAPGDKNQVSVTGPLEDAVGEKFVDIADVAWAKEAILYLEGIGVLSGYGDKTFRPNNPLTREEFVKIIVSAFRYNIVKKPNVFSDVDEDSWYYEYVSTAHFNNLVSGYEDGRFGVGDTILRQDMALIMYRVLESIGADIADVQSKAFSDDADIDAYAREAVYALKGCGYVNGDDNGNYNPKSNVTRAEAAVVVYRILKGEGAI